MTTPARSVKSYGCNGEDYPSAKLKRGQPLRCV
jgi:hypothetical protein